MALRVGPRSPAALRQLLRSLVSRQSIGDLPKARRTSAMLPLRRRRNTIFPADRRRMAGIASRTFANSPRDGNNARKIGLVRSFPETAPGRLTGEFQT